MQPAGQFCVPCEGGTRSVRVIPVVSSNESSGSRRAPSARNAASQSSRNQPLRTVPRQPITLRSGGRAAATNRSRSAQVGITATL